MKRSDLMLVYLALLTLWLPGSSQAQNAPLAGTGYPTSMNPWCCPKPIFHGPSHRKPKHHGQPADRKPDFAVPVGVQIFDKRHNPILALEPLSTDSPFEMYFSIPIAKFQNKCGGLLPGNFEIGYDFLDNTIPPVYRTDTKGTLQSFKVSITVPISNPPAYPAVFDPQDLRLRTAKKVRPEVHSYTIFTVGSPRNGLTYPPIETGQRRYRIPEQIRPYFVAGNTLTLHAIGFNNIYIGVWCRNPE